ncbi:hypothetical protein KIW84_073199 [Lathyrus oleraceus]|uniref:Uncharacterized protein n=1 Tax=Pisum sativum TaxID=3888 RepID=A0A9D4ZW98_PEA|nr:hypothetical protein KIW84_073199 [Pisum sativum]
MLATKLDNIFLRYTKIFINLSIFDIKEGFVEKKETNKRFPEFHDKGKEKVNFAFNERGNVTRGSKFGSKIEELSYTNVLKKYVYNHSKRFNKAFIWVVEHARNSYNIHESFNLEGYFSAKVTPLGENLFLLEDKEEGELAKLMELGASLLMQWFEEIRRWEPSDVDQERIVNQNGCGGDTYENKVCHSLKRSSQVNGCPTYNFHVTRGLKQGDHVSHFLFILDVEGLAWMVDKASSLGEFQGFKIKADIHFDIP